MLHVLFGNHDFPVSIQSHIVFLLFDNFAMCLKLFSRNLAKFKHQCKCTYMTGYKKDRCMHSQIKMLVDFEHESLLPCTLQASSIYLNIYLFRSNINVNQSLKNITKGFLPSLKTIFASGPEYFRRYGQRAKGKHEHCRARCRLLIM